MSDQNHDLLILAGNQPLMQAGPKTLEMPAVDVNEVTEGTEFSQTEETSFGAESEADSPNVFPIVDPAQFYTCEQVLKDLLDLVLSTESDYQGRPGQAPFIRNEVNDLSNANPYHSRILPQSEAFKLAFQICAGYPTHLEYLRELYAYAQRLQAAQGVHPFYRTDLKPVELVPFDVPFALEYYHPAKKYDHQAPPDLGRFRVHIFFATNPIDPEDKIGLSFSFRRIPPEPWSPVFLNWNSQALRLQQDIVGLQLRRGLVLICGGTKQGKSTSLVTLLELINEQKPLHIVMFEKPVEHVFEPKRSRFTQIEVGLHCRGYEEGARNAMRTDCDILVFTEIREPESAIAAINYAATGHLVVGTIHAWDTVDAIQRLVELTSGRWANPLPVIAGALEAVVAQRLIAPNPNLFNSAYRAEIPDRYKRMCLVQEVCRFRQNPQIYEMLKAGQLHAKSLVEYIGRGNSLSNDQVPLSQLEISFEDALAAAARTVLYPVFDDQAMLTGLSWISDQDAISYADRKDVVKSLLRQTPFMMKRQPN